MDIDERRHGGFSYLLALDIVLLLVVLGVVMHTQMAAALGLIEPAVRFQDSFWDERKKELCGGLERLRPWPSGRPGDPISQVAALVRLRPPIEALWAEYERCLEPVTVVIEEDLLHFTTNRFDAFDDPPQRGYATILGYVNQYVASHGEIYVVGHTDERFTEEYNDLLSYRRALHVAQLIGPALRDRGLVESQSFNIYPVGRGERTLLPRTAGETDEAWWKRSRRIELSFRSKVRPGRTARPS